MAMVCRWKDTFFKEETTNEAKFFLIEEVEKEMAGTLPVSDDWEETAAARRESSSSEPDTSSSAVTTSIIGQMRKRIRLSSSSSSTEEENSSKKVLKDYLKLLQEEYHVLRFELY